MAKDFTVQFAQNPAFAAALSRMAIATGKDEKELVTEHATKMLKRLVGKTPKDTGRARAGFIKAWQGLGIPGSARAGIEAATQFGDAGYFKDERNAPRAAAVWIKNQVEYLPFIRTGGGYWFKMAKGEIAREGRAMLKRAEMIYRKRTKI
jgi:hypothetical protein